MVQDENPLNDSIKIAFTVGGVPAPIIESFESPSFPPARWSLLNSDNEIVWQRTTLGSHSGNASAYINLWNYSATGKRDQLRLPNVKFASVDTMHLDFWMAHAQYPNANDSLVVKASTDCGNTWTRIYAKGSNTLKTTATMTPQNSDVGFIPSASDWRKESISLSPFKANEQIMVEFESYNNYGNNIFIDDVSLNAFDFPHTDVALQSIDKPGVRVCSSNEKPVLTIKNIGLDTLKSLKINYQVDSGVIEAFNWTGLLSRNELATVTLPAINSGSPGSHNIKVYTSQPNDINDKNNFNDTMNKKYKVNTIVPLKERVEESFTLVQFPPAVWDIDNKDNDLTWEHHSTIGFQRPGSAWFNGWKNTTTNSIDDLYMPTYSYKDIDSIFLHFNLASVSQPRTAGVPTDTLSILLTKDCGNTFTTVYKKWDSELQTTDLIITDEFFPKIKSQWRKDSINLSEYLGNSESQFSVIFRFNSNSKNNLFIDDVSLFTKKLPQLLKERGYLILPTITQSRFGIWHYQQPTSVRNIKVYNSAGQLVWQKEYNGNAGKFITVDLSGKSSGIYFVTIGYQDKTRNITERIFKR